MKMKCKVKVTLVQALRFCTARTAHRRSRGMFFIVNPNVVRIHFNIIIPSTTM